MKIVLILAIYLLTLQVRRYRLARFFHTQFFAHEACAMIDKVDKLWHLHRGGVLRVKTWRIAKCN
jgi:hypothetical protein